MATLYELLDQYCPDGVTYKALGELGDFYGGLTGKSKEDFKDGNAKFITYMNVYSNPALKIDVNDTVKVAPGERQNCVQYGDVLFTGSSETPDECGMSSVLTERTDEKLYLNSFCMGFRLRDLSQFEPGFLKHLFRSHELRKQIGKTASGVTRFNVSKEKMRKVKIPVPPIEVQREIVRILDNFTELTAELTARKKQYEYYRDHLLSFSTHGGGVPRVKLRDIATEIFRGAGIRRDEVTEEGIPCVRYGEIYTTYNTWFDSCVSHTKLEYVPSPKYFEHGDILFAITGESVEDIAKSVAYVGHDRCLAGGDIVVMKHNQNPRYLAHVLSTSFAREQKSKGKVKSKVVHSNVPSIERIEIPLPPLDVQERYANVLDNFETICNDLNIGLPAEIEARKKQYEFYRDLLLTFMETGSTISDRQTDRQTG